MMRLTFLCNEYIDRPKLSEQKNPFEYIAPPPPTPPPHKWGRNNYVINIYGQKICSVKMVHLHKYEVEDTTQCLPKSVGPKFRLNLELNPFNNVCLNPNWTKLKSDQGKFSLR